MNAIQNSIMHCKSVWYSAKCMKNRRDGILLKSFYFNTDTFILWTKNKQTGVLNAHLKLRVDKPKVYSFSKKIEIKSTNNV